MGIDRIDQLTEICKDTLDLVREQPNRHEINLMAERAAKNAVTDHMDRCPAAINHDNLVATQAANTTQINLMRRVSNSIIPKSGDSSLIKLLKILVPILITLGTGGGIALGTSSCAGYQRPSERQSTCALICASIESAQCWDTPTVSDALGAASEVVQCYQHCIGRLELVANVNIGCINGADTCTVLVQCLTSAWSHRPLRR